uniref:Uncharacterized protein n=1 Tax=viral metagenome TaxID=1070528 RepID=A0A6C0AD56_9ZZZZ
MKMAIDNKIHFIRIFQEDVWNNKNSWEEKMLKKINKCFKSKDKTKIYYISSNNCYDEMKKLIKKHLKEEEINIQKEINSEKLCI